MKDEKDFFVYEDGNTITNTLDIRRLHETIASLEDTREYDDLSNLIARVKGFKFRDYPDYSTFQRQIHPAQYIRHVDQFYHPGHSEVGYQLGSLKHRAGYDASLDVWADSNDFPKYNLGLYSVVLRAREPMSYLLGYIDYVGDEPEPTYEKDDEQ